MSGRFVALGDSFTEGVGDWNPAYPNGCRGWADRVARQLAKAAPTWQYANLAVRSKVLGQILEDQLEPALALRPTLVSFYAGGNDMLSVWPDMKRLMATYRETVLRIADTGAHLLLFTSYDVQVTKLMEPFRPRNNYFNARVREIAEEVDATLVDYHGMTAFADRRMWDHDRLHMSRLGHRYLAQRVLEALTVDHTLEPDELPHLPRRRPGAWARDEATWIKDSVWPALSTRARGIREGDSISPKWPDLVYPAEGFKTLAKRRAARLAEE